LAVRKRKVSKKLWERKEIKKEFAKIRVDFGEDLTRGENGN
jgi:hypothetical protein